MLLDNLMNVIIEVGQHLKCFYYSLVISTMELDEYCMVARILG